MALNGISTLPTKEARQKAKLDLAASDRSADGNPRDEYDLSQLPTQYYGNEVIDNNNAGGLVQGRPWITGATSRLYGDGFYGRTYTGYWANDPTWFATAVETESAVYPTNVTYPSFPSTTSLQIVGYFLPRTTETYTFYVSSDDESALWVGSTATTGFTIGNALVKAAWNTGEVSNTISLTAGIYYPVRLQYGNGPTSGNLTVSFSTPSIAKNTTFTDLIFFNTNTNGL